MRKLLIAFVAVPLVLAASAAVAQSGSDAPNIADVARKYRNTPRVPAKRILTNDDVPSPTSIAPPPTAAPAPGGAAPATDAPAKAAPQGPVDKNALKSEWKQKIDAQRKVLADLQGEAAKSDTELKQRASSYYVDAGTRLRNEQKYMADDRKIHDDDSKRQEKIGAAQAELDKLLDDARKAGVEGSLD
jgi:hypothetical protein